MIQQLLQLIMRLHQAKQISDQGARVLVQAIQQMGGQQQPQQQPQQGVAGVMGQ